MATSPSDLPLARVPPIQLDSDKDSLGLTQLAISRGSNALLFVTCLALVLLVSATNIFSYVTLALCLQLCPRIRERQRQSILQLISLKRFQDVLEQLLEEFSRTNSPNQPGCLARLGENGVEVFGEPLKPSSKRLCAPEERHSLIPLRPLRAQGGSRYHHCSCTPSRKSKPLKRDEVGFLSGSIAARASDPGPSPLPQNKPRQLLQPSSSHLVQGSGSLIRHSSQRSISKEHPPCPPHPGQPYRAQLPAPLEAPHPPPVPTPPKDHLSQAASPRTATQTSSSAVCILPKVCTGSDQLTANSKQQGFHISSGLPPTDASEYLQPRRTELSPTSKSIQASFTAGVHFRAKESPGQLDFEPDGITYVGGEAPKKRKRETQSSSRQQDKASGAQNTNGTEESPDPSSENDSESSDEHRDRNPNPNEKTTSPSQGRRPFFRCPRYSAEPQRYDDTKCKHWRGRCIADVTRHSLKDAGEGSDEWNKIKKLSKAKLSPRERWKQYFVIFNDGTATDRMNYPYWVNSDAEDQVTDFLRSMMDQMKSDLDATSGLMKVQEYYKILMEKKRRDESIRLQCQVNKTAAMKQEAEDLETSRASLNTQFETLIGATSMAPSERQRQALAGLTTPGGMPEVEMNNLDAQLTEAVPDPCPFMSQTGLSAFYGNPYLTPQQPVKDVITATHNVMVGVGHSDTTNNTWQSHQPHAQQLHRLPAPLAYMPSDSMFGSSRRSVHQPISSANSTEDNSHTFSFNCGTGLSGDTSPFDYDGQNLSNKTPFLGR